MKRIVWVGSALKDLKRLPPEVQQVIGRGLLDAQHGGQPLNRSEEEQAGIETPQHDVELVRQRLKMAENHNRGEQHGRR